MSASANKVLKLSLIIAFALLAILSSNHSVAALTGSDFQAGNIISPAVFTDYNAMSVSDIQNFLNSKMPSCDTNGAKPITYWYDPSTGYASSLYREGTGGDSQVTTSREQYGQYYDSYNHTIIAATPYTCLPSYSENGLSAAQIIYNAAQNYHINPKVIIVTLQKEQGLLTDDWPWQNEYQEAMGYMCPDTPQGCSSAYAGFGKQVDSGAWQFRYYLDNNGAPGNFWTGSNNIPYNPSSSCGSNIVNIQNGSTAALYDYTPYQPNSATLSATNPTGSSSGPGGSVSCGAYGNRNFWWYFTSWFGSTQTTIPYAWNMDSRSAYIDSSHTQQYSDSTVSVAPGGKAYLSVIARNNGYQTWTQSVVKLGTNSPTDRSSVFADTSWASANRILMAQSSVNPGDTATFNFSITAPTQAGSYTECFNLLAENVTWMNDPGLCYQIDVVASQSDINSSGTGLTSGQSINVGQYLISPAGHTVLVPQTDGNLVLYSDFSPTWWSSSFNKSAAKLIMQSDGNLVLYTSSNIPLWDSETSGNPGAYLVMQDDGNVVIYSSGAQALWAASFANPAVVHRPGQLQYVNHSIQNSKLFPGQQLRTADGKYRMILQTDGNLVLYSPNRPLWASGTDGKASAYLAMQTDGNLVLYDTSGKPLWYSKTAGQGLSRLVMQDDGNLVVYNSSNRPTWNTQTQGQQ